MNVDAFRRACLSAVLTVASFSQIAAVARADIAPQPPEPVAAAPTFTQITAGEEHTCGRASDGNIYCWGSERYSQLGDDGSQDSPVPVLTLGINGTATAVSAGNDFNCALLQSGGVTCWGRNTSGQLGDGSTTDRSIPTGTVSGLSSGVTALATGGAHSCALLQSGGVVCWGNNFYGQLGDNTNTDSTTPVPVSGLASGVVAITAGSSHTCALLGSGGVKCWGSNGRGQLGDGTLAARKTPVDVTGLASGVAQISAGGWHTCARLVAGGVKCWGSGWDGDPGDYAQAVYQTPLDVSGLPGPVAHLSTGTYHTCAALVSGAVVCWGTNWAGELGDGTGLNNATPVQVIGLTNAAAVAAGYSHSCALLQDGSVKCWGDNQSGQIGNGETNRRAVPNEVVGLPSAAELAIGRMQACALVAGNTVRCWGGVPGDITTFAATLRPTPTVVPGLTGVAHLSAGSQTSSESMCALLLTGGVKCWGNNWSGQLGDGTTSDQLTPVDVVGLDKGVLQVAAGGTLTCALTESTGVLCWGNNYYGQLGDGTTTNHPTPAPVNGLGSAVDAIDTGGDFACALSSSHVQCWGANFDGQLGDGTTQERHAPVDVMDVGQVDAITTGGTFACALLHAQTVKCWGDDTHGQLGNGNHDNSPTPVDVTGLSGVVAIAAGENHACAVTVDGAVKCWGANTYGQLGDGMLVDSSTPVDVVGLSAHATAISAGATDTCVAVGSANRPKCFGAGGLGQLGLGFSSNVLTPMPVVSQHTPILRLSYDTAKPGSFLTLTGTFFPLNHELTFAANGSDLVGTITTTATGEFVVFLDASAADTGSYVLSTSAGSAIQTTLALETSWPLHGQEGGGTVIVLPGGVADPTRHIYLPGLLLRH